MFETNPAVKNTFEKFRQMDAPTELFQSSVLHTHGMVVMNAIDEIITSLDEEDRVEDMILEQGRSHVRFGDDLNENIFWVSITGLYRGLEQGGGQHQGFILGLGTSGSVSTVCTAV